jgi:hypothetical protein
MSLGVVLKGHEGIVLAADSRVTLQAQDLISKTVLAVNYDNATKLLTFAKQPFVAAVTYGAAVIGRRTAHSLLPEFEVELPACDRGEGERLGVAEFAKRLSGFYLKQWHSVMPKDYQGPDMTFVVGGFDKDEPYGSVFLLEIPSSPAPVPRSPGTEFGITWGGQLSIASRVVQGFDPALLPIIKSRLNLSDSVMEQLTAELMAQLSLKIPFDVLPLQDCIDLSTAMITSTMVFQDLAVGVRGVGGPIDIVVVTRKGVRFLRQKELRPGFGYAV